MSNGILRTTYPKYSRYTNRLNRPSNSHYYPLVEASVEHTLVAVVDHVDPAVVGNMVVAVVGNIVVDHHFDSHVVVEIGIPVVVEVDSLFDCRLSHGLGLEVVHLDENTVFNKKSHHLKRFC